MKTRLLLHALSALTLLASVPMLRAQATLANALDATDLVWTTGGTGDVGWSYEAGGLGDNTFDGVDAALSGAIGNNGETWMETTVEGPGTISFWWQAFSEPYADWLEFYIGSTLQASISGALPGNPSGWQYCSFAVPAGTQVLKWRYVKDYGFTGGTLDCVWVDQVRYVSSPPPPLSQALNTSGVEWRSSGSVYDNGWFSQTNITHDGQWAAQSGAIWHNQTNWLEATVIGATNVSFWWAVSSQTNKDYLEFYINGELADQISGVTDWQSNYFTLSATTNVLTWLYRKNDTFVRNADCGWLDQVNLGGMVVTPPAPFTLRTPMPLADGRIQLTVSGEVGRVCQLEYTANPMSSTGWTQFTNFTTTSVDTTVIDSTAANSPMRYYRAVSQ
jgi:hypothetical protein